MKDINTDICIIGGGAAGLSLASGAIQMGANVVLFEKGKMGGDCLNYGCIPSKTLLANAKTAFLMKKLCMQHMPKSKKSLLDFKDVKKIYPE
jgi:pyruvate/2-oxoglutarate dehydrogenase complex dihydrolipoamide dehydrogenase (E3) component